MQLGQYIYVLAYCLVMCFLAFLCGYIFSGTKTSLADEENTAAIRRIRNAVGGFFLLWTILFVLYVPLIIYQPVDSESVFYYRITFFIDIFFWLPSSCYLAQELLQYKFNKWLWLPLMTLPILGAFIWFLYERSAEILWYTGGFVFFVFFVFAFCYSFAYRRYMRILKSEYSNLSHRDVRWTIYAYIGLVAQMVLYIFDYVFYSLPVALLYDVVTMFNAIFITYCAMRMLPVDHINDTADADRTVVDGDSNDLDGNDGQIEPDNSADEVPKAIVVDIQMIQQRLESRCEATKLFLDQQLTRDVLCHSIGVNRNYLAQYFREKNISYYNYINNLRINYACELLIQEGPTASIKDVALKVGYISYRSFYNSFCEIKGCKPSDFIKKTLNP